MTGREVVGHPAVSEFGMQSIISLRRYKPLQGPRLGVAAIFIFHHYEIDHMQVVAESRVVRKVVDLHAHHILRPHVGKVGSRGGNEIYVSGNALSAGGPYASGERVNLNRRYSHGHQQIGTAVRGVFFPSGREKYAFVAGGIGHIGLHGHVFQSDRTWPHHNITRM